MDGSFSGGLRILWRYFRLTYLRWWWAIYFAIIGLYELAGQLVPKTTAGGSRLPELETWVYWVLAAFVIIVAPIPVFFTQQRKESELEAHIGNLERRLLQLMHDYTADLDFGELSMLAPATRIQNGLDLFSEIEKEIKSGDYRRAGLVVPTARLLMPLILKHYGSATGYFPIMHAKVRELIGLFVEHDLADIKDVPRPLLPARDPDTGLEVWPRLPTGAATDH